MANNVEVTISADGAVAVNELDRVGNAATSMSRQAVRAGDDTAEAFDEAARGTGRLGAALDTAQGSLGQVGEGFAAVGDAAGSLQDAMQHSERKAAELARAKLDVEQAANDAAQAIEDMSQANRDAAQAEIDATQADQDAEQALLDKATAQKELNEAIKKFGPNSDEARQARLNLGQAEIDYTQALEDGKQAERDAEQAKLDSAQASTDLKSANLDAADANRQLEESSSSLTKISEWGGMLSGVLGGLTGVLGLVTVVQWAWNASLLASPITWIVLGIGLLVAAIVLIATKTDWFQKLWRNAWNWIKNTAGSAIKSARETVGRNIEFIINLIKNLPDIAKKALRSLANFLMAPFKAAFNGIARAWNSTVGGFGFSVPGWVPGIGGNSFSIPNIPTFAVGGDVLRTGLAMIHAGETIVPTAKAQRFRGDGLQGAAPGRRRGADSSDDVIKVILEWKGSGNPIEDAFIEMLKDNLMVQAVIDRGIRQSVANNGGGNVQATYGKRGAGDTKKRAF